MKSFIHPVRVYYEDTDAGGIVHHANYLKFFDRARTESLRQLGFELVSLLSNNDAQFAVHSAQIEFLHPARLDQLLYVVTEIAEVGFASIRYNQRIHLETVEGRVLCRAKIKLACLNAVHRPNKIPNILLKEINKMVPVARDIKVKEMRR